MSTTTKLPEPSLERLRCISAVAQHVGHNRPARVVTYDGGVYVGRGLWVDYDEVVVGPPWRLEAIHLPLAIVARIERYELRVRRALLLGASVVVLGAVVGAGRDIVSGDPLLYHDGLLLGIVLGGLAAPFVVWLAQGIPSLKHWHVIIDEQVV